MKPILYNIKTRYIKVIICQIYPSSITNKVLNYVISLCDVYKVMIHKKIRRSSEMLKYIYYKHLLVMGIGYNFENGYRYTNIDRWSIIGDNYLLNVFTDYNYSNSLISRVCLTNVKICIKLYHIFTKCWFPCVLHLI